MVTDQDNQQNTPLHYAVENEGFEVAELLIEKGESYVQLNTKIMPTLGSGQPGFPVYWTLFGLFILISCKHD